MGVGHWSESGPLPGRAECMKVLKIGLLLDSPYADKYVHELARWAKNQSHISISHLLVHPRHRDSKSGRLARLFLKQELYLLLSDIAFRLIISLEKLYLKRSSLHSDHYRIFDLSKLVDEIFTLSPIVSKSGLVYRFSTEDIEKIRALDLDLLIRCGSGILRGDILHASRLGIISFHHGDNRINRGGPAGFWECYYEWPQTGFIIQRLTEELDAGEVLVRGSFATRYIHSLNQAELCKKSNAHLKNLLNRIALTGKLPPAENTPIPYSSILFQNPPRLHQCVVYGIKVVKRILIKGGAKILGLKERWGISLLSGNWGKAVFWRSTEVKPPRGRFWADPFLCLYNGITFCFVEDFIYKTNRGHITALEIMGTKVVERGIAVVLAANHRDHAPVGPHGDQRGLGIADLRPADRAHRQPLEVAVERGVSAHPAHAPDALVQSPTAPDDGVRCVERVAERDIQRLVSRLEGAAGLGAARMWNQQQRRGEEQSQE